MKTMLWEIDMAISIILMLIAIPFSYAGVARMISPTPTTYRLVAMGVLWGKVWLPGAINVGLAALFALLAAFMFYEAANSKKDKKIFLKRR